MGDMYITCILNFSSICELLGGAPNYYPNSFSAPETQPRFVESKFQVSPDVARYNSADDDNVTQVLLFYWNAKIFIIIVQSD